MCRYIVAYYFDGNNRRFLIKEMVCHSNVTGRRVGRILLNGKTE